MKPSREIFGLNGTRDHAKKKRPSESCRIVNKRLGVIEVNLVWHLLTRRDTSRSLHVVQQVRYQLSAGGIGVGVGFA